MLDNVWTSFLGLEVVWGLLCFKLILVLSITSYRFACTVIPDERRIIILSPTCLQMSVWVMRFAYAKTASLPML